MPTEPGPGADDRRPVLRLLLLLDKKPGHFHQTEGVALALGRVAEIEATRLKVRQRPFILVGMLRLAMKLKLSPRFGLRALYDIRLDDISRPDGIIASGRSTAAAAILLARHFGVPLVFSGRPGGYDKSAFTLQLVGKRKFAGQPGFAFVPKPSVTSSVSQDNTAAATPANSPPVDIALFLGGDSTNHVYREVDWDKIIELMSATSTAHGVRWHVSTSRRSPAYIATALRKCVDAGSISEFVDYQSTGPGSARHFYGMDAIVVTHDSRSMISEAISSRRPLLVLKPENVRSPGLGDYLDLQEERNYLKVLALRDLTATTLWDALANARISDGFSDPTLEIAAAVAPVFGLSTVSTSNSTGDT